MIDISDGPLSRLPDIAGYRVLRRIDAGGQAAVYAAESNTTGRLVAVKVLHDPAAAKRLEREARFLSTLRHPGIVTILDAGRDGDRVYLVTDFIEGIPIDDFINLEDCDVDAVVDLLITACDAVSAAHAAGILHRDLKPANMLVTEGRTCYIVDFGLAADEDTGRNSSSSSGSIVGTVDYCPPERLRGAPADFRGDVYALGMALYECLADNLPYGGETRFDRARAVVFDEPLRLRRASDGHRLNELLGPQFISRDLEAVVMKAIAKEPERRYPTVDALAADLRRCRAGEPVEARYGQRGYLARRLLARHRAAVAVLGVMILTLAGGFAWATYSWRVAERAVVHTQTALQMASLQYSGDLARGSGSLDTAVDNLERSLGLAEIFADPSTDVQLQQYNAHYRLAEMNFDEGDNAKARHHAEAAIALAPGLIDGRSDQTQSASVQVLIGKIAMRDERYDDAAAAFLAAADEYERFSPRSSGDYVTRYHTAYSRSRAGYALSKTDRVRGTFAQYTAAIALYERLLSEYPENQDVAYRLSSVENRLAVWYLHRMTESDIRAASALIDEALARLERVTDDAMAHDTAALLEGLQTNRDLALRRLEQSDPR